MWDTEDGKERRDSGKPGMPDSKEDFGSIIPVSLKARLPRKLTGEQMTIAVPFGTDASTIAEAGIPAVVFGPGDIRQAHTKDEWIELDQIERAAEILYRLALS